MAQPDEPHNPLLPTISKSFNGLPTLGPILETGQRRTLIGWDHKKDTPEGLLTGRLWCWVSDGTRGGLQVSNFPYRNSDRHWYCGSCVPVIRHHERGMVFMSRGPWERHRERACRLLTNLLYSTFNVNSWRTGVAARSLRELDQAHAAVQISIINVLCDATFWRLLTLPS